MRLYERGLIAPGDAIAVAGPAFFRDLNDARQLEGWRPDVEFVDAATIDEPELMAQILLWDQHGRRVLSDSYSAGGRWTAQWVLDSGPLFWFVGEATQLEQDFTDLSRLLPEDPPSPRQHRLLTLMALERARYRRALNEPTAAVAALPLATDRRRSVVTRLQLSRSVRPYANQESELSMPADGSIPADALVVAEAGDLLFAHGEHDRGADLLLEAAAAGLPSALGALVRWQLRAGLDVAAWTTLETLVRGAEHRDQAIDVLHWMVARERYADASRLAVVLAEAGADVPSHAADEIAARLLLQRALAVEPGRPIVGPTNPTISRR
jgi:hypothetical protein